MQQILFQTGAIYYENANICGRLMMYLSVEGKEKCLWLC
mgnify:CR=1 FL=1